MDFFRTITLIDILDVVVLATLVYQVLLIFRRTRATQLILGLFYFAVTFFIAFMLGMSATLWVFERLIPLLAIALLIIFQPELRNFFERAGRRGLVFGMSGQQDTKDVEQLLVIIGQALEEMAEAHTGALIVIERDISLGEYINTGERIDANVRKDLLKAIFYKGNPLHDGAVIIRNGRIVSARSFLPLSENQDIPSHLGTRHRAALGITEISDAISLVASEETGHLSLYNSGKPAFRLTPNTLRHMAKGILVPETDREGSYFQFRIGLDKYFRRKSRRPSKDKADAELSPVTIPESVPEDPVTKSVETAHPEKPDTGPDDGGDSE